MGEEFLIENRIELLSRLVPENKIYQDFIDQIFVIELSEKIIDIFLIK